MRRVATIRLALVATVLSLVALAAILDHPAGSLAASRLAGIKAAGATGVQLVNLSDDGTAAFSLDVYNQDGRAPVHVAPPPVAPGGAYNIYLPANPDVARAPAAFAVLTQANQPFAQIARTEWPASGGATMYDSARPGTDVVVPWVVRNAGGASSIVSIQNMDTAASAAATATWFDAMGNALVSRSLTINLGTSVTLDLATLSDFSAVPNDALGYLRVTADRPVAVQTFADYPASALAVSAFNGVSANEASALLHAPLLESAAATGKAGRLASTQVFVVNPGSAPVDVTLDYLGSGDCAGGAIRHGGQALSLAAGRQIVLNQGPGGGSGLPAGCRAGGILSASGPVVAVVAEVASDGDTTIAEAAAYLPASAQNAGARILLPLVRHEHTSVKLGTAITVQNAGDGPATVQLSLSTRDGSAVACAAPCSVELLAGQSHTFDMATTGFPVNMYGNGSLSANQPLAVVVADRAHMGGYDVSMYGGLVRPGAGASAGPAQALPLVLNANTGNPTPTGPTPTASTPPPPQPTHGPGGKVHAAFSGVLMAALGEQTVSAGMTLYPLAGGAAVTLPNLSVMPGAVGGGTQLLDQSSLVNGFYNGLVTADGPLSGMHLMQWAPESAIANVEAAPAGTDLVVPLVAKDLTGRDTYVALQNLSDAPATVALAAHGGNGALVASANRTLAAHAGALIDLGRDPDFAALPLGFVGSLRASSGTAIAVSALVDDEHSPMAIYAFNAEPVASAADQLWVPRVQANVVLDPAVPEAGSARTVVAVANPGTSTVAFSLDYVGIDGPCTGRAISGQNNQVAGGGMIEVDVSLDGLPAGCSAAARVTAAAPVLAVVVDTVVANGTVLTGMAYNALAAPDTARRVVLPLVRRQHPRYSLLSTDVAVQNVGEATATVTLNLTVASGNTVIPVTCQAGCSATIAPGVTFVFQPESMNGLAAGTYGGGVLTSSEPLAVVTLQQSRLLRYDSSASRGSPADLPGANTNLPFPLLSKFAYIRDAGPALVPPPAPGEEPSSPGPLAGVSRLSRLYLPWTLRGR